MIRATRVISRPSRLYGRLLSLVFHSDLQKGKEAVENLGLVRSRFEAWPQPAGPGYRRKRLRTTWLRLAGRIGCHQSMIFETRRGCLQVVQRCI